MTGSEKQFMFSHNGIMVKSLRFFLYHYFFPHHTNNFKAKSLHYSSLIFYILLLLLFQTLTLYLKNSPSNILGYASNITIEKILLLVNQERKKANLKPLTQSEELAAAANQKAADMFSKNYWAHISPTGTTPWEIITHSGYYYIYAGENLAKSFETSDEVVAAWMKSSSHRANILKPEYQEIGLAVVNGVLSGEETTLVVQEFGARSELSQVVKVAANIKTAELDRKTETANSISNKSVINLASENKLSSTKINLIPKLSKSASLIFTEILLIVLLIDSLFLWKHKTIRISGHSLAHIMFFLTLLGAITITGIGVIL